MKNLFTNIENIDSLTSIVLIDDDNKINASRFFLYSFNEIPNVIDFDINIDTDMFVKKLSKLYPNIVKNNSLIYTDKTYSLNELFYTTILKDGLIIQFRNTVQRITYGSEINKDELKKLEDLITKCEKEETIIPKFYMIKHEGGFSLIEFEIKQQDIDIELNYNNDFIEVHNKVSSFLNTDKKSGLILFYGEQGTGKTTYIKKLLSEFTNKTFIYVPSNILNIVSSPDFINFISRHKESILILEDSEKIIVSRDNGNSTDSIINLLNLTDGLLGDALGLKIICTFNTSINNIDKALLRKGRLQVSYEFKKLKAEKVKVLLNSTNQTNKEIKDMTIAEIYSTDKNIFTVNKTKTKNIGF